MLTTIHLAALLLLPAAGAQGQGPPPQVRPQMTYYTVAAEGIPPSGFNSFSFKRAAVARVGNDDHVAFVGSQWSGPNGVWAGSGTGDPSSPLTLVAPEGAGVTGSCGTLGTIDAGLPPHINSAGQVALFALMSGTGCGPFQSIIGRTPGNPLVLLAQVGMVPAGGSQPLALLQREFGLASTGQVAFRGATGTAAPLDTGIWSAGGGLILDLAKKGDTAQGTSNNEKFLSFGGSGAGGFLLEPEYDHALLAGFRANLSNGVAMTGVWTGHSNPFPAPPTLTYITDDTENAPGVFPPTKFSDFQAVAVNQLGQVAFRGCLFNCSNDGIWKGSSQASLGLVARHLAVAPDTGGNPSSLVFANFSNPVINNNGHVAFRATLTNTEEGLWAESIHVPGLALIVKEGDALGGTSLTFASIDQDLVINDADQIAFTAIMSDGSQGLFFVTPQITTVFKIVRTTEFYDLGSLGNKQIKFIDFFPGSIEQGVSGFNQEGSLAYRLSFEGAPETRAVVLTTIDM